MGGPGSGRDGISRELVIEAERLLDAGRTRRQVEEATGLSTTTVRLIALGEHFLQPLLDDERHRRCPGCGGLVLGDCVLCAMRNAGL